jgi:prepilin-type N-terminal cleavage/methylation domain-containing protein
VRASERGFSLVEVLAGLGLTGILVTGILSSFGTALLQHRLADETTRGAALAASRLEELVALPTDSPDLAAGTTTEILPRGFTRRTHIVANLPAPGARTIKVTVRAGSSPRAVTLIGVRPR